MIRRLKGLAMLIAVLFLVMPTHTIYATQLQQEYTEGRFIYHAFDGYQSICGYIGDTEEIVIPPSINGQPVSQIEDLAFAGCDLTTKVIVPDTVIWIGTQAFDQMASLQVVECHISAPEIHVPDSVKVQRTGATTEETTEKVPEQDSSFGQATETSQEEKYTQEEENYLEETMVDEDVQLEQSQQPDSSASEAAPSEETPQEPSSQTPKPDHKESGQQKNWWAFIGLIAVAVIVLVTILINKRRSQE